MSTKFSRPSLGINQHALFKACDDLAQSSASRSEFMLSPHDYMGRYGVTINTHKDTYSFERLHTSEVCSFAAGFCVAVSVVALGLIAVVAASTFGGFWNWVSCSQEWGGCAVNPPLSANKYIGLV